MSIIARHRIAALWRFRMSLKKATVGPLALRRSVGLLSGRSQQIVHITVVPCGHGMK